MLNGKGAMGSVPGPGVGAQPWPVQPPGLVARMMGSPIPTGYLSPGTAHRMAPAAAMGGMAMRHGPPGFPPGHARGMVVAVPTASSAAVPPTPAAPPAPLPLPSPSKPPPRSVARPVLATAEGQAEGEVGEEAGADGLPVCVPLVDALAAGGGEPTLGGQFLPADAPTPDVAAAAGASSDMMVTTAALPPGAIGALFGGLPGGVLPAQVGWHTHAASSAAATSRQPLCDAYPLPMPSPAMASAVKTAQMRLPAVVHIVTPPSPAPAGEAHGSSHPFTGVTFPALTGLQAYYVPGPQSDDAHPIPIGGVNQPPLAFFWRGMHPPTPADGHPTLTSGAVARMKEWFARRWPAVCAAMEADGGVGVGSMEGVTALAMRCGLASTTVTAWLRNEWVRSVPHPRHAPVCVPPRLPGAKAGAPSVSPAVSSMRQSLTATWRQHWSTAPGPDATSRPAPVSASDLLDHLPHAVDAHALLPASHTRTCTSSSDALLPQLWAHSARAPLPSAPTGVDVDVEGVGHGSSDVTALPRAATTVNSAPAAGHHHPNTRPASPTVPTDTAGGSASSHGGDAGVGITGGLGPLPAPLLIRNGGCGLLAPSCVLTSDGVPLYLPDGTIITTTGRLLYPQSAMPHHAVPLTPLVRVPSAVATPTLPDAIAASAAARTSAMSALASARASMDADLAAYRDAVLEERVRCDLSAVAQVLVEHGLPLTRSAMAGTGGLSHAGSDAATDSSPHRWAWSWMVAGQEEGEAEGESGGPASTPGVARQRGAGWPLSRSPHGKPALPPFLKAIQPDGTVPDGTDFVVMPTAEHLVVARVIRDSPAPGSTGGHGTPAHACSFIPVGTLSDVANPFLAALQAYLDAQRGKGAKSAAGALIPGLMEGDHGAPLAGKRGSVRTRGGAGISGHKAGRGRMGGGPHGMDEAASVHDNLGFVSSPMLGGRRVAFSDDVPPHALDAPGHGAGSLSSLTLGVDALGLPMHVPPLTGSRQLGGVSGGVGSSGDVGGLGSDDHGAHLIATGTKRRRPSLDILAAAASAAHDHDLDGPGVDHDHSHWLGDGTSGVGAIPLPISKRPRRSRASSLTGAGGGNGGSGNDTAGQSVGLGDAHGGDDDHGGGAGTSGALGMGVGGALTGPPAASTSGMEVLAAMTEFLADHTSGNGSGHGMGVPQRGMAGLSVPLPLQLHHHATLPPGEAHTMPMALAHDTTGLPPTSHLIRGLSGGPGSRDGGSGVGGVEVGNQRQRARSLSVDFTSRFLHTGPVGVAPTSTHGAGEGGASGSGTK